MKQTILVALMAACQAADMHPIVRQDTPATPVAKCTAE